MTAEIDDDDDIYTAIKVFLGKALKWRHPSGETLMALSPDLLQLQFIIEGYARDFGLDFPEVRFEMLDYRMLNQVAAYDGFPTRIRTGALAWNTSASPSPTLMACIESTRW